MHLSKFTVLFAAGLIFLTGLGQASVEPVLLSLDKPLAKPRWLFDRTQAPLTQGDVQSLERVKRLQLADDNVACFNQALTLRGNFSSLAPWITATELLCGAKALEKDQISVESLSASTARAQAHPQWFSYGAQHENLQQAQVRALLAVLEKDVRRDRVRAWKSVDQLQLMTDWMSKTQRAILYKQAGELAFVQQKMLAARNFILRSLQEEESASLRQRLASVEKAIGGAVETVAEQPVLESKEADLEADQKELDLMNRLRVALASGDLTAAVTDAVQLILTYPGGRRAVWAEERIKEAYRQASQRTEKRYDTIRQAMVRELKKLNDVQNMRWTKLIYNLGFYEDALDLAQSALRATSTAGSATVLRSIAGRSAVALESDKVAVQHFLALTEKSAGTSEAVAAMLSLGLIEFRRKDYSKAVSYLERLLVLSGSESQELSARYWLWRALQKTNDERAEEERRELLKRFPLTYYGLRARAEGQWGHLELPEQSMGKTQTDLWLTEGEKQAWQKVQTLLAAGWLDEAAAEMRELPPAFTQTEKALRAYYWGALLRHGVALQLTLEAWPQGQRWQHKEFFTLSFPLEFSPQIHKYSERYKVKKELVQGLIRQESAFEHKVQSKAKAIGLMQLLFSTANEMTERLKLKSIQQDEDLHDPDLNVQLGTYYLSTLLKKFDGHVPKALAAYNAGPGRLERWLEGRPSAQMLVEQPRTSDPLTELWIDEMPWSETQTYVKAVLRNTLVYQLLAKRQMVLPDPVWD